MMLSNQPWIAVTRPVSVWNKPLKADMKALFRAMSAAVGHGLSGEWAKVAADATDVLRAVDLKEDPGQLAWLLMRAALTTATFNLMAEHSDYLKIEETPSPDDIPELLDLSLEQEEITIDNAFFERPRDSKLLQLFAVPFQQWLVLHGFPSARARTMADRLPTYYVYALHREWASNAALYEPIAKSMNTPFAPAAKREWAWQQYAAELDMQLDRGMLGETFSLRQVYVPLRAYYDEKPSRGRNHDMPEQSKAPEVKRFIVDLEQALEAWLSRGSAEDNLRVISGGPGSGKSCFARVFAARQASRCDLRVLYVPLHQIDAEADLTAAIGRYVYDLAILPHNPLDPQSREDKLLIIFDGLDELAMQGKAAHEVAARFVAEVKQTLNAWNRSEPSLWILITGRELVIQSHAPEWRKAGEVLHVLSYIGDGRKAGGRQRKPGIFEYQARDCDVVDPARMLAEDQR
ncbi:MAG: NACHT domain-containing protein, partial [Armatimonadia bacterium]